jgi:hypothetical protein
MGYRLSDERVHGFPMVSRASRAVKLGLSSAFVPALVLLSQFPSSAPKLWSSIFVSFT